MSPRKMREITGYCLSEDTPDHFNNNNNNNNKEPGPNWSTERRKW
jgi:hypothetical protein